jgi:hypothetical protein
VVGSVIEGSPAQDADIRRNDVLSKLDEQILVLPAQMAVLVQNRKPGEKVVVSGLRRGEPFETEVILGETTRSRVGPPSMRDQIHNFSIAPNLNHDNRLRDGMRRVRKLLDDDSHDLDAEDLRERIRRHLDQLLGQRTDVFEGQPHPTGPGGGGTGPHRVVRTVTLTNTGTAEVAPHTVSVGKLVQEEDGIRIELTIRNGNKHLLATKGEGETVYDGPFDTDEDRERVPEGIRERATELGQGFKIHTTTVPQGGGTY